MKYLFKKQAERGDTIVEVLISMVILALVLAISLVSTSHSLHTGTDAANRLQALGLAQQQVELIKSDLPTYQAKTGNFCVQTAGVSSNCLFASQYTLTDTYSSTTGLFSVKATWAGGGSVSNNLSVYYRVSTSSGSGAGNPIDLRLIADNYNFPSTGGSTTLRWDVTNATACTASGGWSGSVAFSAGVQHSQVVSVTSANPTDTITCTNSTYTAVSHVTFNITAPSLVINFCADSYYYPSGNAACSGNVDGTIQYGGSSTLRWSIANASSCTSSFGGGPSGNGSGTAPTGSLFALSNSYQLHCTGVDGTQQNPTVHVNIPPQPTNAQQYCSPDGATASVSWNKYPGYQYNYLRVQDSTTGNWVEYQPAGAGDGNSEKYAGSTYTWASTPGHSYVWWVHTWASPGGAYSYPIGWTGQGGTLPALNCPSPASAPIIEQFYWQGGPGNAGTNSFLLHVDGADYCGILTDNPPGGNQQFPANNGIDDSPTAGNGGPGTIQCWNQGLPSPFNNSACYRVWYAGPGQNGWCDQADPDPDTAYCGAAGVRDVYDGSCIGLGVYDQYDSVGMYCSNPDGWPADEYCWGY